VTWRSCSWMRAVLALEALDFRCCTNNLPSLAPSLWRSRLLLEYTAARGPPSRCLNAVRSTSARGARSTFSASGLAAIHRYEVCVREIYLFHTLCCQSRMFLQIFLDVDSANSSSCAVPEVCRDLLPPLPHAVQTIVVSSLRINSGLVT